MSAEPMQSPVLADPPRLAVVIPLYNHGRTVAAVVRGCRDLGAPVFVVDDGSTDGGAQTIGAAQNVHILGHGRNRGKGAALLTGMAAAAPRADWAVTLDADGQHYPEDIAGLVAAIPAGERPLIVGCREGMLRERAPWTSRFGREFSNFWVRLAGGPRMADSQSGFRLYPLPETLKLPVRARRFQFEVEVLVQARRSGLAVREAPIRVRYGDLARRISHFHPFFDFLRNFGVFSRLITQRVLGLDQGRSK